MYQFKIVELEEGGYRFELGAIKLFVDGFQVKENYHVLTNPNKAVGYFSIDGNIYGISNDPVSFVTAEAFYDSMSNQYMIFTNSGKSSTSEGMKQAV
jgi:hypothetical protein